MASILRSYVKDGLLFSGENCAPFYAFFPLGPVLSCPDCGEACVFREVNGLGIGPFFCGCSRVGCRAFFKAAGADVESAHKGFVRNCNERGFMAWCAVGLDYYAGAKVASHG